MGDSTAGGFALAGLAAYSFGKYDPSYIGSALTAGKLNGAAVLAGLAVVFMAASQFVAGDRVNQTALTYIGMGVAGAAGMIALMTSGASYGSQTAAGAAVIGCYVYGLALLSEIIAQDVDNALS